jgi:hypothetical protein
MVRFRGSLFVLIFALLASGCANEIAEVVECTMACEHYDDCVADSYDTTGCADACEDMSDASDAYEARVRACDECLDDANCSPDCNDECAGIIPAF